MLYRAALRKLLLSSLGLGSLAANAQISTGSFIIYSQSEQPDNIITATGSDTVCSGEPVGLSLAGGNLGDNAQWYWFKDGCAAGTPIDSGNSITIVPMDGTSTYYCSSLGGCNTVCQQITLFARDAADCAPLPIQLLSFDAVLFEGNKGKITWKADGEDPGTIYELEKSPDSRSFRLLNKQSATGTGGINNYSYIDDPLVQGYNYYRLKSIEPGGSVQYSQIKVIYYSKESITAKLYPNPTQGYLTFEIELNRTDEIHYWVTNIVGQAKFSEDKMKGEKGNNIAGINLGMLAQGDYLFHYRTDSGIYGVIKFSKIN